jgi:hypothetical protein
MGKTIIQTALHPFDSTLFVQVEHIPIVCVMSEIREFFIRVEMVVAEKDVVQLVLFNLFFQPRDIFGKVFAFQAYFYVDLVPVFFS